MSQQIKNRINKLLSIFISLVMVIQSVLPGFYFVANPSVVSAQEATSSTEVAEPTSSPIVSPEPSVIPSIEPTPSPTENIDPTPTPSPEVTPAPSEELTPNVSPNPPPAESTNLESPSPSPSESTTIVVEPSPSPSPEITTEQPAKGHLSAEILHTNDENSLQLNLDPANSITSASLTTDKDDYAPTDTAVISGSDFPKEANLKLIITASNYRFETEVQTDQNGSFAYFYQLDGTYRPLYNVEAQDQNGQVLATTSFTDSPPSGCTNDSGGLNDLPGANQQKDLTKMCADYTNLPVSVDVTWNWDNSSFTGGNTGDACALFDTDNDGKANYAVCVRVGGDPGAYITKFVYSCDDSSATNCLGNATISPVVTTCTANVQATDPFSGGAGYPNDTVASCTINLSDVGGSLATLTDVCSYPSGSTPSNASDCILFRAHAGKLTLTKVLSPNTDPGLFNLQIDGVTQTGGADVGDGGTTLTADASEGTHTVGETAGTNTSLSNYTSSVECRDGHGTGNVVTTTGTNPWTLSVTDGADILCTITNNVNSGTLVVHKTFTDQHSNSAITINVNPGNLSQVTNGSGDATFSNLNPGTYSATAVEPPGYFESGTTCTNVSVTAGQTTNCIITDSPILGTITVHKAIVGGSATPSEFCFTLSPDPGNGQICADNNTGNAVFNNVPSGTYSATESASASGYTMTGNDCTGLVIANNGDSQSCTVTNTRDTGSVLVHKSVDTDTDEVFETTDSGANTLGFRWGLDEVTPANNMGSTLSGVITGTHNVDENSITDYHFVGWFANGGQGSCTNPDEISLPANINVNKDTTTEITLCNARDTGTITVNKVLLPSDDSGRFDLKIDGIVHAIGVGDSGSTGQVTVITGSHTISEDGNNTDLSDYTAVIDDDCAPDGTILVASGQNKVCTITNTKKGDVIVIKYLDNNANGVFDQGEQVLSGWDITLSGQTLTTDVNGQVIFDNLVPDTYFLSETIKDGYSQSNISCTGDIGIDKDNDHSVTLGAGQTVNCQIGNYQDGQIVVTKLVVDPDGNDILDTSTEFHFNVGDSSVDLTDDQFQGFTVSPGVYTVTEDPDSEYTFDGCISDQGGEIIENGIMVTVDSGEKVNVTCTNKQKKATITVIKNVVAADSTTDVFDAHIFEVTLNSEAKNFAEGTPAEFSVNPGTYFAVETNELNYTEISNDSPATVGSNGSATITIVNAQNPGTISGFKYQADGETGLPGWIIELYTCGSDFLNCTQVDSTFTNEDGFYIFSDLLTGFYQVKEVLEVGWTNLTNLSINVTIDPGTDSEDNNFTNFENIDITACKLDDADGNIQTADDQISIVGWIVQLLVDGQVTDSQQTNQDGCFTWTDLGPNHTYGVSEVMQAGWTNLTETSHDFGQAGDGIDESFTFINFKNPTISGKKFNDLDGDHQRINTTTDPNLPGWTITLDKQNDINAPVCTGGAIVGELCVKTTNSSGNYSFINLGPGTYRVSEVLQPGWVQTRPDATFGGQGHQADGTYLLTVSSGDDIDDRDFGNRGNLSITACKSEDSNGTQDGGEFTPVSNWDFTLNDQTTQNTGDGNCTTFINLTPGEYSISENPLPNDWFVADDSQGNRAVVLTTEDETVNFYNFRQGEISGLKWDDKDGNGELDCEDDSDESCEFGLEEWTIFIDENGDGSFDEEEEQSTSTDENGNYSFSDLEPGTYRICEVVQPGWAQTYPEDSELNNCYEITLNSGDISENNDFGNQGRGTITVNKDVDSDGDGDIDTPDATDWTWDIDSAGNFSTGFTQNVAAGTYTISEDQKNGYHVIAVECNNENIYEASENIEVTVEPGQDLICTFTNTRDTGTITILKNVDSDGDGEIDVSGSTDWTWDIAGGEQNIPTGNPRTLVTGSYTISEDPQAGFALVNWSCSNNQAGTTNEIILNVTTGSEISCTFTNEFIPPVLTLTKTNNKLGSDVAPGSAVLYTLTLQLSGNTLNNVILTDLLPNGFTYQSGSWTATSNQGPISVPEPSYASPGQWQIGQMVAGETVTLTLTANIDGGIDFGLYKDLAWAKGDSQVQVLANENSGIFVGTQVNVTLPPGGPVYDVARTEEREGEVLGASIALPQTGADIRWIMAASLLLGFGITSFAFGLKIRRKYE